MKVQLLLQGRYEYFMQYYAARPIYGALLRAGVEIHEYSPSFLHAKVAVIDGRWATVGSSNLDPLSLLLAREANVVVDDAGFAAQLRGRLLQAMQQEGRAMNADEYQQPPAAPACHGVRRHGAHAAGPAGPGPEVSVGLIVAMAQDLIVQRPEGLYCPPGDFYIDPWRPVARAVITHAHSDHARIGNGHYLAAQQAEGVLRTRLGEIELQTLPYGAAHSPQRRRRSRCIPPAMCWARPRCAWNMAARSGWPAATTRSRPTRPARPSSR